MIPVRSIMQQPRFGKMTLEPLSDWQGNPLKEGQVAACVRWTIPSGWNLIEANPKIKSAFSQTTNLTDRISKGFLLLIATTQNNYADSYLGTQNTYTHKVRPAINGHSTNESDACMSSDMLILARKEAAQKMKSPDSSILSDSDKTAILQRVRAVYLSSVFDHLSDSVKTALDKALNSEPDTALSIAPLSSQPVRGVGYQYSTDPEKTGEPGRQVVGFQISFVA